MRLNVGGDLDVQARHVLLQEITRRIRALPGVESAALTDALPLERNRTWTIGVPGKVYQRGERPLAFVYITGPGLFETMGMRVQAGRELDIGQGRLEDVAGALVLLQRAQLLQLGAAPALFQVALVGRHLVAGQARLLVLHRDYS